MTIDPWWWTRKTVETVSTGRACGGGAQQLPRDACNDAHWQRSPPRGPATRRDSIHEVPKPNRRPTIVGK